MIPDSLAPLEPFAAALQPAGQDELPAISPAELWAVMERQVALYTNISSSSVPAETAAELLESVLFCVRAAWQASAQKAPQPLAAWLLQGQRVLLRRHRAGLALQKQAEARQLALENDVYREVLLETKNFFTWYDIRFMAHHIPCMIDYPLALPVSETLKGIDYITAYLQQRLWEDALCSCFPPDEVNTTLDRHHPLWRQLPINMFEPVFAAALAAMQPGQRASLLAPGCTEQSTLPAACLTQGVDALALSLKKQAGRLCNSLHLWPSAQRGYYVQYAATLAPRILAASPAGRLHIFGLG